MMTKTIQQITLLLLFFLTLIVTPLKADECLPDLGSGNICTAKDFELTQTLVSGPATCIEGEIIPAPVIVRVGMEPTANERYDIGFFVGDHGESPIQGDSCTFISLTPIESGGNFDGSSGYGPYRDLDNNQCGDTLKTDGPIYREIILNDVLCEDTDNNGEVDIAFVITWQQQKGPCDDPLDSSNFYPPTSSKCIAGIVNIGDIAPIPPEQLPSIRVQKSASPTVLKEPGGNVLYSISVENNGPVAVTVTSLEDDKFGPVNGAGSCSLPQYLEVDESYSCTFPQTLSGTAGTTHTNTITAGAEDGVGNQTSDNDNATVTFIVPTQPTASIGNLVWNDLNGDGFYSSNEPGIENVTLVLYRKEGVTHTAIDTTITSAGGHYDFTELPAGSYRVRPDTITAPLNHMVHTGGLLPHDVILEEAQHYILADFGFSQASIIVTKTVDPDVIPAPSATVNYTIRVQNDGAVEVTLIGLYDNPLGDLTARGCILPHTLLSGEVFSCAFPETITGSAEDVHANTILALARDQDGNHIYGSDSALVTIIDPQTGVIGHFVWNDLDADGSYDPGEPFFDNVTLTLSGTESAATRTDNGGLYHFGDLAAGTYAVTVTDDNNVLQQYVLTSAENPHDNIALAEGGIYGRANFGYAKAQISIQKTADKKVVVSGTDVTFTVTVSNTGRVPLTLTTLNDSQFGDLTTKGCPLPPTLAGGEHYTCTFTEAITGNPQEIHQNVATVTAEDDATHPFYASDNENVYIIGNIGGAIGHLVWFDANGDGIKDSDESGIDGITIDLLQNGSIVGTTVTFHGGQYIFLTNNGTYEVQVTDTSHLLDGTTLSGGSNPHTNIVINNSTALDINFGYTQAPHNPVPLINIEKSTNGVDADNAPGPMLKKGANVTWNYVVENIGPYFLSDVTVSDDQGELVSCPKDTLDIGESMTCTAKGFAIQGQYKNIGIVVASVRGQALVHSRDPSHYYGNGFPWELFPIITPCATDPLYCLLIADSDNQGSRDSRLFKYSFREDRLEPVNYLGVTDVETMTYSLDGKKLYAVDSGTLGTISQAPGITGSFNPLNSSGLGSGTGAYGIVDYLDIDGLAFDPTDGTLYATVRYREQSPGILDLLIKIDPATGTAIKNAFGMDQDYITINTAAIGVNDADDIAIDNKGILYGVAGNSGGGGEDQGIIINKNTGTVHINAPLIDLNGQPIQDMEGFTSYNHDFFYGTTGLEFREQGTDNSLYRIEKSSGTTEFILRLDQEFDGYIPGDFEAIACFPVCK